MKYSTGDVVQHGNIPTKVRSRREIHEFSLEPRERIVAVTARSGWMLDQLTFTTNQHREIGPFGGPGGSKRQLSVPNQPSAYLAYLKGCVDDTQEDTGVRHVEFVWAYFDNDCERVI